MMIYMAPNSKGDEGLVRGRIKNRKSNVVVRNFTKMPKRAQTYLSRLISS